MLYLLLFWFVSLCSFCFVDFRGMSEQQPGSVTFSFMNCMKGLAYFLQQTKQKCYSPHFISPPLPSVSLLLPLPFKPSSTISLDIICIFLLPSCSWTVLICVSLFSVQNLQGHRLSAAFLDPALGFLYPGSIPSPPHQAFCLHPHLPLPSLVPLTLLAQVQRL